MIFLFIAAIVTSAISSVTGMAGGVVLLSLMTFSLPVAVIIPIHGLVQLFSNSFRVYYLRESINKRFIKYFVVGVPLGASISVLALRNVFTDKWIFVALAILIAYSLFKPKKLPSLKLKLYQWSIVGIIAGALAIIVGSVGPFLAAFFVRDDLEKKEIISTKASMQMLCHFIKIPSFLFIGFDYKAYGIETALLVLGALIGTKFGVIILDKINDKVFKVLFKSFLAIALIRIVFKIAAAA